MANDEGPMTGVRVKICGITNVDDALRAVAAGADALGFVFYPKSPRYVLPEAAARIIDKVPAFVTTVGVFVNEDPGTIGRIARTAGLDVAQLHGDEEPAACDVAAVRVMKALRVRGPEVLERASTYEVSTILLDAWVPDAYGGTGERFDWEIARELAAQRPVVLSGGLNSENVAKAVKTVRPWGVDVSSGVEADGDKRRKNPEKVRRFIEAARGV